jgi:high-affinity nickel-transport protein
LGHSTVVVVFIIAIAVSSDIYDKVGGFGDTGGIIGKDILALVSSIQCLM